MAKIEEKEEAKKKRKKSVLRETIEAILIAFVLAMLIRTFVVQAFKIPSSSMEDTLLIGDHILVSKLSYGLQVPKPHILGWHVVRFVGLPIMVLPIVDSELKPLWGEIKRGDVIVFRFPQDRTKDFIKRVVGLPGETVVIKDGRIYIDGKQWKENFGVHKGGINSEMEVVDNFGPYRVPEGCVFVMGDNRDRSYDSRFWGCVNIKDIKGRAFMIYFSWDHERNRIRFSRIGKFIQ